MKSVENNSIHLLINTTDFDALFDLLDMSFSLLLHFLPMLSLETNVCSILRFDLFFWGHVEYKIVFAIYDIFSFGVFT